MGRRPCRRRTGRKSEGGRGKLTAALAWGLEWGPYIGPDEDPEIRDEVLSHQIRVAPWAETPWRAWHELSGERGYTVDGYGAGMGAIRIVSRPLPIPWRAVREWCVWNLIRPEDRDLVLSGVQALDRFFVRWRNDRLDQEIRQALRGN